jgi:ATP-dependent protease HslVU (ClpYQ) peptidase subunit
MRSAADDDRMTVVAGVVGPDGTIHMGADSAASTDRRLDVCRDPKIFANGDLLIGYVGSVRVGQVLREAFDAPRIGRESVRRYMVAVLVPAVRAVLLQEGCIDGWNADALAPGWLLVGARGRLFRMCGDFQIAEPYQGFDAIGSGGPYALGALHATSTTEPRARIRGALLTAETFTPNVRRPFTVRQLARQAAA